MDDNDEESGDGMPERPESKDEHPEQSDEGGARPDETPSGDTRTEEQLQAELQEAAKSGRMVLWVHFSLNIAVFVLAIWLLLSMVGLLPAADTLLYVWFGMVAGVFALQLDPDIKRVKRIRKDLDS